MLGFSHDRASVNTLAMETLDAFFFELKIAHVSLTMSVTSLFMLILMVSGICGSTFLDMAKSLHKGATSR